MRHNMLEAGTARINDHIVDEESGKHRRYPRYKRNPKNKTDDGPDSEQ